MFFPPFFLFPKDILAKVFCFILLEPLDGSMINRGKRGDFKCILDFNKNVSIAFLYLVLAVKLG